jgi:aminoglycoside phosphotransferase (APT) family kinase protein
MTTLRTTTRDPLLLRRRLDAWLATLRPGAFSRRVRVPAANGLSSETVLFDLAIPHPSGTARQRILPCVLRLAADPDAYAVFPAYDMELQYRTIATVAERTRVPVPELLWLETDPGPLGAPFFVMKYVDGRVPPDLMPYTYGDNWLFDAAPDDRLHLERSTVAVLAELHTIPGDGTLRQHVDAQRAYYTWVVDGLVPSPVIERAFAWLDAHWPSDPGPSVLSWGDARIGNILYQPDGFDPAAVLDWEMTSSGPRELDLAWLIYLHRFFQDLTESSGHPGLPDFLDRARVADTYASLSGHTPRDLDFHTLYAALRHAVVMLRVGYRQVHFGERPMPADPDDLILHRESLEAMVEGRYWV